MNIVSAGWLSYGVFYCLYNDGRIQEINMSHDDIRMNNPIILFVYSLCVSVIYKHSFHGLSLRVVFNMVRMKSAIISYNTGNAVLN